MNGRLQFFLFPDIPGCTDLQANDIVAPTQSLYLLLCPGDSFNCHQSIEDDLHVEGPQLHCHFCMYQRTDIIWVFELNKLPQSLSTPHFENIGFQSPWHALKVQIAAMSSILPAACFSDGALSLRCRSRRLPPSLGALRFHRGREQPLTVLEPE